MDLDTIKQFTRGGSSCYLPNFDEILFELKISEKDFDRDTVQISKRFLKFLISVQLVAQNFDEQSYLAENPDVVEAVRKGDVESGWAHYVANGYFEGRSPGSFKVQETWYRRKYPDVGLAERRGKLTLSDHYARTGRKEGRAASELDEKFRALWKAALA